jgi:inorganic pyrophosphatase
MEIILPIIVALMVIDDIAFRAKIYKQINTIKETQEFFFDEIDEVWAEFKKVSEGIKANRLSMVEYINKEIEMSKITIPKA